MTDPLGIISHQSPIARTQPGFGGVGGAPRDQSGASFKEALLDELQKVNELQRNADRAIEDLAAGRRDDLESVLLATEKADTAFRMLLAVRNKVMDAYEEVKQIRV